MIIQTTPLVSLLVGTRKMRCLILCLNETWEPTSWRSFASYRRWRRDVLMGHRGYVPLRRCWVFHLRPIEMSRRPADGASSLRPLETSSQHTNNTSWRRTTETSLDVSFERYLRRRWVHCLTVFSEYFIQFIFYD